MGLGLWRFITLMRAALSLLWMQLRERWEYGHAAGFVVQLAGLAALVTSVLAETRPTSP